MEIKLKGKPLDAAAMPKRIPIQTPHGITYVLPHGYKLPEPSAVEIKEAYEAAGIVEGTINISLEEWLKYKNNLTSLGKDVLNFLRNSGLEIPLEKPEGIEAIIMEFGKEKGPEVLTDSVLWAQTSDGSAEIFGRITYNGITASEILIKMAPNVMKGRPTKEECGPHKDYFETETGSSWQIALVGLSGKLYVSDIKRTNWRAQPGQGT